LIFDANLRQPVSRFERMRLERFARLTIRSSHNTLVATREERAGEKMKPTETDQMGRR
jgi:hypothetical protein